MKIHYKKAWRAIQHALKCASNDRIESCRIFPAYFKHLISSNLGTFAFVHMRLDDTFLYSFFSLSALIYGFLVYVRPVIIVDATNTKDEYKGIIMTALA